MTRWMLIVAALAAPAAGAEFRPAADGKPAVVAYAPGDDESAGRRFAAIATLGGLFLGDDTAVSSGAIGFFQTGLNRSGAANVLSLTSPGGIASPGGVRGMRLIPRPGAAAPTPYLVWGTDPPRVPDCPRQSESWAHVAFTGRHAEYTQADTWYPSWASDGNLYSPWTDGYVTKELGSYSGGGETAITGYATIVGDDPLRLQIVNPGTVKASAVPYEGRYPCGSLVHNGIWYYGTYCLKNEREAYTFNWGVLGPFVGLRYSRDLGKTWTETTHTAAKPLFPEPAEFGGKVRIGAPHFVDFGRNMEHSPDGKAYLVAHGAVDPDAAPREGNLSWITGDQIYLLRVKPSIETINDASAYEFFGGRDPSGRPIWTSDFGRIRPLLDYNNHCGCVTVTYNAPLKKYLMCMTDGGVTTGSFDTYVLEADEVTGPWRLVNYLAKFGMQAYFVNIPSKFISADGRTMWLCYSANFVNLVPGTKLRADPPDSRYGMCLQEIKLLAPGEPVFFEPFKGPDNVARRATVTASSVLLDSAAGAVVDGLIPPSSDDTAATAGEWASNGEGAGAFVRLSWPDAPVIDRIWLFDRAGLRDQVTSGTLLLSDGSTAAVGALPDDTSQGVEIQIGPRSIRWLMFFAQGVKPGTRSAGLSEIAVFQARARS